MKKNIYWQYLKYVCRHKWYVFVKCWEMGIVWRGITHDMSKFLPSEFIPYARYFYGDYPGYEDKITAAFNKAWLYHIHRNPHHWQFWLLQEDDGALKRLPIPLKYVKEMISDWRGAGLAITGKDDTEQWYSENKKKILLNSMAREIVEQEVAPRKK